MLATVAMQAGKLLHRPHIPMLEERNTRKGFFELEMLHSVLAQLPAALRPVIEFAYITGWRISLRSSHGFIVPRVFVRMVAKGRNGTKEPRPIRAFTKAWKTACTAGGCPGRIPHDLRRTAIRNMVRRGLFERVAMTLAGHKTRSVFERYNIVSDGDLRAAAAKLQGLTGTEKGQSGSFGWGRKRKLPNC